MTLKKSLTPFDPYDLSNKRIDTPFGKIYQRGAMARDRETLIAAAHNTPLKSDYTYRIENCDIQESLRKQHRSRPLILQGCGSYILLIVKEHQTSNAYEEGEYDDRIMIGPSGTIRSSRYYPQSRYHSQLNNRSLHQTSIKQRSRGDAGRRGEGKLFYGFQSYSSAQPPCIEGMYEYFLDLPTIYGSLSITIFLHHSINQKVKYHVVR